MAEVAAACGGDPLVLWGAQGMARGVRAWALGEAVAVACPDLNRRDRLTVCGEPEQVAALAQWALERVGPSYRVVGSRALVGQVAACSPGLRLLGAFEWMDTHRLSPVLSPVLSAGPGRARRRARWLDPKEDDEVSALLAAAAPSSWAAPGVAGVRRWAGVRDEDGVLVAVAADAWSCPQVGFVAGVATAARRRGAGYGEAVCRLALGDLLTAHGRVALMVDTANHTALALYGRLGLRLRPLAAAALDGA
ncbi:GNAT family N-acetyltransferase [Streptosporangium amethystogenes]|uniref:GNAT family N-acetyltransferase n=1 Tax=Streptosporangium amethystogenes TaxID=2002 RepID=UPI0004C672F8|nr:GNAT family N-acetyltransferase [Streptosporangium amethystogenes]